MSIDFTDLAVDMVMSILVNAALTRTEWAENAQPDVSTARQRLQDALPEAEWSIRFVAQTRFRNQRYLSAAKVWSLLEEAFDTCFSDIWNTMKTWPGRAGPAGDAPVVNAFAYCSSLSASR